MGGGISIRTVLWYLIFAGFAVNYSFRININIAIVSMVKAHHYENNNSSHSSECFEATTLEIHPANRVNFTSMYINTEEKFDWNEKQQGLILGAFFWIHWLFQVPGGMLAQKYGTKLVFGLSNVVSCCFSFLIPMCARADYRLLIFLRAVQGLISGLAWPSMHLLVANWIPPTERSKFVSAYMGSSIGVAMTYPLCGFLINWFGWPSVFYVTGAIGVIWFIAWWILVYDSPTDHPYISITEQEYILSSLGESVVKIKPSTPWKKILLCRSVWMNVLAQWGNIWGLFTLMTQAPTYFRFIHGWDIRTTGLLSGVPHLCRTTLGIGVSALGDLLLKKGALTQTGLRKVATGICCIGQGLCVLALALSGCNAWAAIVFLTMATAASGAVSTGPLASYIDISPNFSSIMLGISNMLTVIPGFISPVIVGTLTYQNQTVSQWTIVFIISAIMLIIPGILYAIFASSELQEWNTPRKGIQKHEMEKLRNADENKDLQNTHIK